VKVTQTSPSNSQQASKLTIISSQAAALQTSDGGGASVQTDKTDYPPKGDESEGVEIAKPTFFTPLSFQHGHAQTVIV
jgi:hypothetical protein